MTCVSWTIEDKKNGSPVVFSLVSNKSSFLHGNLLPVSGIGKLFWLLFFYVMGKMLTGKLYCTGASFVKQFDLFCCILDKPYTSCFIFMARCCILSTGQNI